MIGYFLGDGSLVVVVTDVALDELVGAEEVMAVVVVGGVQREA